MCIRDRSKSELSKLDGVKSTIIKGDEIELKIENKNYAKGIFDYVSKCKNVTKFEVVELSLHEIFTKEVGVSYDK